ncbi:transglycosylase domain-containing protein [Bacillus sp. NPDC077027]|uniref:transglycosylase domain-containing protein n=1 Tax=Bacillus sp. NPDC077027 TaxID=3390548 RepID=UPI003D02A6AC
MKKKKIIIPLVIVVSTLLLSFIGYLTILFLGHYVIDEKKLVFHASSKIIDRNGKELTSMYSENRDPISLKEVPDKVAKAFVAVEDKRFYEHHGIDAQAVSRAIYRDILAGGKVEGGSTITQQLAKNIFLTNDKTFLRKTKEVIIAINLERDYTKDKLLEMYLNQLYFGHGLYGIQAAANYYFDKDVQDLTVSEGATLAAIPKAPSNYSPVFHPDKNKQRRDTILNLMNDQGYLNSTETVEAKGRTLGLHIKKKSATPWFDSYVDLIIKEAEADYSISHEQLLQGGYTITVPIDMKLQKATYDLMKDSRYFPGKSGEPEGSAVFINNETGGVKAAIGGRNYQARGYNRVTAVRQPGSVFKPIAVYGPAMQEKKFKPYSLLEDKEESYNGYTPKNYDGQYEGQVTMVDALMKSKNTSAVWTLNQIGIDTSKSYLGKVGIDIPDDGLALALGGLEKGVSPLQIAGSFHTFANEGEYKKPFFITKISNEDGDTIEKNKAKNERVYSVQNAWNMTRMLEQVVKGGTAQSGSYAGDLAGKTGTTTYSGVKGATKDAWFAGYTPSTTGTIWMGYDKTDNSHYLTGGSQYPVRLFKDILTKAQITQETFEKPAGIKELQSPIRLSPLTGFKASYVFKMKGLFTLELSWDEQEDKRTEYRIYEKRNDNETLIDTVTGTNSYSLPYANIFSDVQYRVVPYNTQTKEEGEGSSYVKPEVFSQ